MHVSNDVQVTSTYAAGMVATTLREAAQASIVRSFRAYVDGDGPGPSDENLQTFARLVVNEQRLRRLYANSLIELSAGTST